VKNSINMSDSHIGHKERKKQREEEQKRLLAIEKNRKSKRAATRRHRKFLIFKAQVINFFTLNFLFKSKKGMKSIIGESSHEQRIQEHIKQKIKAKRVERFKEFLNHPFGKTKTAYEKQQQIRDRLIAKRVKEKGKAIRIANIRLNISNSLSSIRNPSVRKKLIKQLIPSTISFMIAYIILFIVTNVATSLMASFWDIRTRIETSIIYYEPSPYSPLWNTGSVVSIYSTQVFLSFVLSLTALWVFTKSIHKSSFLKSILIWMVLLGQAFAWGAFFGAFIRKQEVYHAIIWGFFHTGLNAKGVLIALMVISFIWLIVFGYLIKPILLYASSSAELLMSRNRFAYYHSQYTIPFIISIIFIFIINAPVYNIYLFIQLFSLMIIFIPFLFDNSKRENHSQIKVVRTPLNNYVIVGGGVLLIILFKLIFDMGISF
jgi:hypothetical protein